MRQDFQIESEIGGKIVKSPISFSAQELLDKYSDRCTQAMWNFTEDCIAALIPEGVNTAPWVKRHDIKVNVADIRNGVQHRVLRDGECVAKVTYRNGVITSKLKMGR